MATDADPKTRALAQRAREWLSWAAACGLGLARATRRLATGRWPRAARWGLLAASGLLVAVAVLVAVAATRLNTPLRVPEDGLRVALEKGDTLNADLLPALRRRGVLPEPHWLSWYARLSGKGRQVRAGVYHLADGDGPLDLLDQLVRGDAVFEKVTLQEGWTLLAALRHLQSRPDIRVALPDARRADVDAEALVATLPFARGHEHLEGLFFPDTYLYHAGATDRSVLRQAYQRMQEALAEEWSQRDLFVPYDSPYQALILASIVEAETGLARERAKIAGVFVRRLQKNMRLETDPAVIYGLGADFDGDLRHRHLQDGSNPYNTYQHSGLPPTPIALPGLASIRAAMQPDEGASLFFVARGDGSHAFSETLSQHRDAVRAYQLKLREGYRSAPASAAEAARR